jgi:hypothetical protein
MVEVWESIPKYFFTPRQISQLRTEGGLAEPYKWNFSYNDSPCTVKIQPALIEQENGKYKAFFPSVTEELSGSPYFCESSFWASKPKFAAKA